VGEHHPIETNKEIINVRKNVNKNEIGQGYYSLP